LWLTILFFGAMLTARALGNYGQEIEANAWLVFFIPLVISTGGNSGSQSATLIITAMSSGDVSLADWARVVRRELLTGLLLGGFLGMIGYVAATVVAPNWMTASIIPLTVLLVVTCGTLLGSVLPMVFRHLGLDPAMMSNPFVAGIIDIVGILIYMETADLMLHALEH
ncbi:MAG: magnesium transporter, partial [Pirellulales bacterium]